MAETIFLTNDALTRKKWARDLFKILLPATEINSLVGRSAEDIIQLRTELGKGEGDQIKFGIRLALAGAGRVGREKVEGNEEELRFKDFNCTIEELNHAVNTGGRMEAQRMPYDLMVEAKDGLQYWWADKISACAFAHLCGDTTFQINGVTFAQDPTDPDTDHWMRVNDAASDAAITSAEVIDLSFLDRMKQKASLPTGANCVKVRPLNIKGKQYFRVILHDYVFDRLRQNTNVGQWGDLLRSANKLAMENVEIEYNGMLISKSERITQSVVNGTDSNAGTFRNILVGAQAAVMAWGGAGESKSTTMSFVPYTSDAKRFMNVRGGGIFGIKKVAFQSKDYGVIVGSSWGAPLE